MYNILAKSNIAFFIILGVFALLLIGMYILRSRSAKKDEQSRKEKLDSLKPGVKVLTIDYTYGVIVATTETEVVIETGDEDHKGYIRLDKRGIYQIIEEQNNSQDEAFSDEQQEVASEAEEGQQEVTAEKEIVEDKE